MTRKSYGDMTPAPVIVSALVTAGIWLGVILSLAYLAGCAASLPPNSPKEHSTTVQCARSAPIMGWGGGTVFAVTIDSTSQGGTFKTTADCGGIDATMYPQAPKTAASGP